MIHFVSNFLVIFAILSPMIYCGANDCNLYEKSVNEIRRNGSFRSATSNIESMMSVMSSTSHRKSCFTQLLQYINELSNLNLKNENLPQDSPQSNREHNPISDEEEYSKKFLRLTSKLLSAGKWEATVDNLTITPSPRTGASKSPTFLLQSVERIIDKTVSKVINNKLPPSSDRTHGIFFESDQITVEYESGRSNYTDHENLTVISTKYKTISDFLNQSVNRSCDDVINHTPYCRKWQFSDNLCNETSQLCTQTMTTAMFADDVLSINAFIAGRKRSLPIHIDFRHDDMMTSVQPLCVFFDTHMDAWSDKGCHSSDGASDDVIVTCKCNHTTTFALVLLVATPNGFQFSELDDSCIKTFHMISFIMGAASVIFLISSLVIFIIIAMTTNKQIERITIHTHLAIALLLFNVVLISDHLQDKQKDGRWMTVGCYVIMLLIQFAILSVFFWMLIEAYSIYRHVIRTSASGNDVTGMGKRKYLVGWGIPFCITCTTLAVGITQNHFTAVEDDVINGTSNGMSCLLNGQLNWATFIPILMIMLVNLLALVRIFVLVVKLTNKTRNMQPSTNRRSIHETHLHSVKKGMTSLMKLFPILGIPWIIALLSAFVSPQLFCYLSIIHSLVNGSQGVVFFIVCVVRNEENRKTFQHSWKRMNASFTNLQINHHDNTQQNDDQQQEDQQQQQQIDGIQLQQTNTKHSC